MEGIDSLAQQSLVRYFNVLENTGYVKDKSVNQLILLQFLSDFLNGYQEYITEEDYNLINNIITCLTNNCLIPYRHFKESFPVQRYYLINQPIRITEDSDIRDTQKFDLRLPV